MSEVTPQHQAQHLLKRSANPEAESSFSSSSQNIFFLIIFKTKNVTLAARGGSLSERRVLIGREPLKPKTRLLGKKFEADGVGSAGVACEVDGFFPPSYQKI